MGGSLFRIYRDVRFSKDKTPYKTAAGVHFHHEDRKNVHAPGYYLHLEPGTVYAGGGIWRDGFPRLGLPVLADEEEGRGQYRWQQDRRG